MAEWQRPRNQLRDVGPAPGGRLAPAAQGPLGESREQAEVASCWGQTQALVAQGSLPLAEAPADLRTVTPPETLLLADGEEMGAETPGTRGRSCPRLCTGGWHQTRALSKARIASAWGP